VNIEITDIAAQEIKNAFIDNEIVDPFIIFYVAGGGCSGLQYGLAISDGEPEIDEIITYSQDIKIAVESKSAKYVDGAIIDYVTENGLMGGFKITNPTAVKSCGCGKSFSAEDSIETLNNGSGCSACKS
jgi:iron-sulfur cluster assembly accessory protein